jgi:hypothetical protein
MAAYSPRFQPAQGPKDGDCNNDGLVFRDGGWRREEDPVSVRVADPAVGHAIPTEPLLTDDNEPAEGAQAGGARITWTDEKGREREGQVFKPASIGNIMSDEREPGFTTYDGEGKKHLVRASRVTSLDANQDHVGAGAWDDYGEKIGGARKDLAALRLRYDRDGTSTVSQDDATTMEADPAYASKKITRDGVLNPAGLLQELRGMGMGAGAAFVLRRVLNSLPAKPGDSAADRQLFWIGCSRVRVAKGAQRGCWRTPLPPIRLLQIRKRRMRPKRWKARTGPGAIPEESAPQTSDNDGRNLPIPTIIPSAESVKAEPIDVFHGTPGIWNNKSVPVLVQTLPDLRARMTQLALPPIQDI